MTDQTDRSTQAPQSGDPSDLLGLDAAAELLGVPVEQVRTMVDQGIITEHDEAGDPCYRRSELLAAREMGG
jgi:hypothetical protein